MTQVLLIRPGATEFDEQERLKGCLRLPLGEQGRQQVAELLREIEARPLHWLYHAPTPSAEETAQRVALVKGLRPRVAPLLQNVDHGLWHGKSIAEIRGSQPKAYRQWQDHPESACPPGGEAIDQARKRVSTGLAKILRGKFRGVVGLVVSEPLATLVEWHFGRVDTVDLWCRSCDACQVCLIDVVPQPVPAG